MKNHVILALAGLVIAVSSAAAVDLPPGQWWENERLVRHLQLTEDQQSDIRDMVYAHAQRMIDLNASVERTKLELERLTKARSLDASATRKAFAEFQQARVNLEAERFEMLLSVRQLLTDPQWQELISLRDRVETFRRNRDDEPGAPSERPRPRMQPPGRRPQ